eukprot:XP_001704432.1 Hypothetical protein GL50803_23860 [Giardia lamblia ATCC 50803]
MQRTASWRHAYDMVAFNVITVHDAPVFPLNFSKIFY